MSLLTLLQCTILLSHCPYVSSAVVASPNVLLPTATFAIDSPQSFTYPLPGSHSAIETASPGVKKTTPPSSTISPPDPFVTHVPQIPELPPPLVLIRFSNYGPPLPAQPTWRSLIYAVAQCAEQVRLHGGDPIGEGHRRYGPRTVELDFFPGARLNWIQWYYTLDGIRAFLTDYGSFELRFAVLMDGVVVGEGGISRFRGGLVGEG